MSETVWLASVEPAHAARGRVRFSCRFRVFAPCDWNRVRLAAEALPGVKSARVNAKARCLVLEYDDRLTDVGRLRQSILAFSPVALAETGDEDRPESVGKALVVSLLVLLGTGFLPRLLQFSLSLATASPL
ncbi:MAG: heavy-metal-associated domain-containing protein, partial [Proteobacteria bacterium]|nr:heavy-metal-associated domain-containing protein [Pseudomonadota bacterium]